MYFMLTLCLLTSTFKIGTQYDERYNTGEYIDIRGLHVDFGWKFDHTVSNALKLSVCVVVPWLVTIWFGATQLWLWPMAIPLGEFLFVTIKHLCK
jgi:hypothetical protein